MLQVTESLIDRECNIQVRKWRESRGELTHQPGRRHNGTRAIYEYKRRADSIRSGGSFSFLASSIPPPGPLRASSSLLSLPGFRRSKNPFHSQSKKSSFSGPSGMEGPPPLSPPPAVTSSPARASIHKPPIPPGAGQKVPQVRSPLVGGATGQSHGSAQATEGTLGQAPPVSPAAPPQSTPPPNTLSPSPRIVSEQITQSIPSPTANNAPLPPFPDSKKEAAATADAPAGEQEGKKKKKVKDSKKKDKEEEKKKLKERKEKEKVERERLRKENERLEKEKKKASKKKDKGGGEAEEKNGAAAAKDSA